MNDSYLQKKFINSYLRWSDNNEESVCYFYYAVMRALLTALTIHLPIWIFFRPKVETSDEVCLRMFYAGIMGVIQPIILLKLFPDYWIEMKNFFLKYSQNTKRTWQSAGKILINQHFYTKIKSTYFF